MTDLQLAPLQDRTDLAALVGVDRLLVRREDLTPTIVGGCKALNMRRLLAAAKGAGADTVLMAGRAGSNAVAAACLLAPDYGINVHAVLRPQPDGAHARHNLAIAASSGCSITPVSLDVSLLRAAPTMRAARDALVGAGRSVYVIGFGASDLVAGEAHYEATLQLHAQCKALGGPPSDSIYMAAASFSSGAGVLAALCALQWRTRLVLVSVAQDEAPSPDSIWRLAHDVAVACSAPSSSCVELDIRESLAPGFGRIAPADANAIAPFAEALALEPTYTGKAFCALTRDAEAMKVGRALFWHTGIGQIRWPAGLRRMEPSDELTRALLIP